MECGGARPDLRTKFEDALAGVLLPAPRARATEPTPKATKSSASTLYKCNGAQRR